jgi:hypothetical protein
MSLTVDRLGVLAVVERGRGGGHVLAILKSFLLDI